MDNSRPKYKKLDRFFVWNIRILGVGIFPLWMPRINTAYSPLLQSLIIIIFYNILYKNTSSNQINQ